MLTCKPFILANFTQCCPECNRYLLWELFAWTWNNISIQRGVCLWTPDEFPALDVHQLLCSNCLQELLVIASCIHLLLGAGQINLDDLGSYFFMALMLKRLTCCINLTSSLKNQDASLLFCGLMKLQTNSARVRFLLLFLALFFQNWQHRNLLPFCLCNDLTLFYLIFFLRGFPSWHAQAPVEPPRGSVACVPVIISQPVPLRGTTFMLALPRRDCF